MGKTFFRGMRDDDCMKLRIHSNSLRLRLSQSEVTRLGESGSVEEKIAFGGGPGLSYAIESGETPGVSASFDGARIRVLAPSPEVRRWIESDQTGIEASSGPLRVIIEKDFQCLHRESEEDADSFPNPLKG